MHCIWRYVFRCRQNWFWHVFAWPLHFQMPGWSLATLMLTNHELLGAIEERQWMVLNVRWLHEATAKVMADEIWTRWYDFSASLCSTEVCKAVCTTRKKRFNAWVGCLCSLLLAILNSIFPYFSWKYTTLTASFCEYPLGFSKASKPQELASIS